MKTTVALFFAGTFARSDIYSNSPFSPDHLLFLFLSEGHYQFSLTLFARCRYSVDHLQGIHFTQRVSVGVFLRFPRMRRIVPLSIHTIQ